MIWFDCPWTDRENWFKIMAAVISCGLGYKERAGVAA